MGKSCTATVRIASNNHEKTETPTIVSWRERDSLTLLMGIYISLSLMENSLEIHLNTRNGGGGSGSGIPV